ncbi:hypothetical protein, partial [Escherichia coli]
KPVVHARAGVKPPADIPRSDYNDYMVDLYLNRLSVFAGRALMDELVNRKDFCIFILMYLIDIMEIIYI